MTTMAVVPPRQVAILSVANYDEVCACCGEEASDAAIEALRALAIGCGVDPGYMRRFGLQTLLLRLDELPRETFLASVQCMITRSHSLVLPDYPQAHLEVHVGAMSERALRSLVDDAAADLLSYMHHTDCTAAFLAGDELDIWRKFESANVEFISHEQLKHMDPFTGLLTGDYFLKLLQDVMDDFDRYSSSCTILYFDIDDFKSYNRTFDHAAGDELLLFVAHELHRAFPTDVVAHLNVDRFCVITSTQDVARVCASIHENVRAFKQSFAPEIKCGIYVPEKALSAHIVMDCAKMACESIKGRYDIAWRIFDESLRERLFTRRYVARHAEQAVTKRWIHAFAQPVIDTNTRELCGFEALARWRDPERGLLSPAVFIPTLEDAHLIHKLDTCIVDEVCEHISRRLEDGLPTVAASINLSRLDFQLCDIFQKVTDACERWHVPHSMLAVEVTESALDDKHGHLYQQLNRFRQAGFEVWMDDFGCGYSSLNLLKDYEFDVLKVDMEFLRDMESNDRSKTIVASVIELAKSLGIRTLVEGVETVAQRDFLRAAGCDMMQGYLFGKPAPLDTFDN